MNAVILIGRFTKEPETRNSQDGTPVTRFTLAVDRRNNRNEADFISCVAFSKTAEFISKYFHKGNKITIRGHIQTGNYTDQNGNKVYTTDVIVDDAEFTESKSAEQSAPPQNAYTAPPQNGYYQPQQSQNGYVAPPQNTQSGYNVPPQPQQNVYQSGYYQQSFDQYNRG